MVSSADEVSTSICPVTAPKNSEDRQTFINVVRSFEKELPFEERPDLVSDWEFLYERSLGSIGVLKEWLVRAATVAARKGSHRLTRANLEAQALSVVLGIGATVAVNSAR